LNNEHKNLLKLCVIRRFALTVSDVCLKLGCFQSTSTYSSLEVSHFMRYRDLLTYLLTLSIHVISNDLEWPWMSFQLFNTFVNLISWKCIAFGCSCVIFGDYF